jgi:site-specific recombinase XerD
VNRRITAVRGLCEFAVISGVRADNPVPTPRHTSGLRAPTGLLGHVRARRPNGGGRLVRQPRRLPDSLPLAQVEAFLSDLVTSRDRAIALLMLLGGLRSAEVRSLLLRDVDMGARQVRVVGKGRRDRVVPVDRPFFTELAAYLRQERPPGCATPQCFVVLRGPTTGGAMTEAGLRRVFRTHRARAGQDLGWSSNWVRQVTHLAACTLACGSIRPPVSWMTLTFCLPRPR